MCVTPNTDKMLLTIKSRGVEMKSQRVVLVTGVSSGLGQAIARQLAQNGLTVFGTSRNPSQTPAIPGVEILPLDMRSGESVQQCIETVLSRTGRLDVLIN